MFLTLMCRDQLPKHICPFLFSLRSGPLTTQQHAVQTG
jgi:hypothetical protein